MYNTKDNSIYVYYNQKGANSEASSSLCKSLPVIKDSTSADYFANYNVFSATPEIISVTNSIGLHSHPSISSFIPGQLRVGDLDSDGYPDLMTTLSTADGGHKTVVLTNEPCSFAGSSITISRRRTDSR